MPDPHGPDPQGEGPPPGSHMGSADAPARPVCAEAGTLNCLTRSIVPHFGQA